jgi:hypothetical protein
LFSFISYFTTTIRNYTEFLSTSFELEASTLHLIQIFQPIAKIVIMNAVVKFKSGCYHTIPIPNTSIKGRLLLENQTNLRFRHILEICHLLLLHYIFSYT